MEQGLSPTTLGRQFPDSEQAPTILTVPGLNGSLDGHWQSQWERERDDCLRADLGQWHDPKPEEWIARLDTAVRNVRGPVVLAAHSLGCIAVAHWAAAQKSAAQVIAALLVAPCDPEAEHACVRLRRFAAVPAKRLPFRSAVIASSNDPYATLKRSCEMAVVWKADFINIGMAGHINAGSNLGSWPLGQQLLQGLFNRDQARHRH